MIKIDISNKNSLGEPLVKELTNPAQAVYVSGNYLYVADSQAGLAILDKNFTPTADEINVVNKTNNILALIIPYISIATISIIAYTLGRKAMKADEGMKKTARNTIIIGILVVNGVFYGSFFIGGFGNSSKEGMFPGSLVFYGADENLTKNYFVANGNTPFIVYCDHYFVYFDDPGIDITVKIYENETNTLVDEGLIYMYSTSGIQHDSRSSFASTKILHKSTVYRIEFDIKAGSLHNLRIYSPRSYLELTHIYVAYNQAIIFFITSLLSIPTTFILGIIEFLLLKKLKNTG